MLLKDFMRAEGLTDAAMADLIGDIGALTVRKLRFRARGPSIRVAARIHEITGGRVTPPEMQPKRKSASPSLVSPRPAAAPEGAPL